MSAQFQYSLLQYHHLQREEWLTVGVLVFFAEQKEIRFLHPEKLGRLRIAFPDAPEKLLRNWLKGLEWQAEKLVKSRDIFADYNLEHDGNALIADHFLPSDSSALQFGTVKSAVQYSDDVSLICNHLDSLYLAVYNQDEDDYGQKDDSWIVSQYRKLLRDKNPDILSKNRVKEKFTAQYHNRDYKFDFAWQNHTFNLVKAVSFDLKRTDSIQKKGIQYFGQFSLLQGFAKEKQARFDVLLSKPSSAKLFQAFDKAVEDINQAGNVNIVEDISSYAEKTLEEVIDPPLQE